MSKLWLKQVRLNKCAWPFRYISSAMLKPLGVIKQKLLFTYKRSSTLLTALKNKSAIPFRREEAESVRINSKELLTRCWREKTERLVGLDECSTHSLPFDKHGTKGTYLEWVTLEVEIQERLIGSFSKRMVDRQNVRYI